MSAWRKFYSVLLLFSIFSSVVYAGDLDYLVKITSPVNVICWNKDSSMFAIAENDTITVRDAQTLEIKYSLFFDNTIDLAFSEENNGENLPSDDVILGISNQFIALWNLQKESTDGIAPDIGYLITPPLSADNKTSRNILKTVFSNSSDFFAAALSDGSIQLYFKLRYTKETVARPLEGHKTPVTSLSFNSDDSLLASVSSDGNIRIWKTNTASLVSSIDFKDYKNQSPVIFSPDSNQLIVCAEKKSGNELVFLSFDGKIKKRLPVKNTIREFTVTPDGRLIIILTENDSFEFYRTDDGSQLGYIPTFAVSKLMCFAFNEDCTQLLTGHQNGSVYKLNVQNVLLSPNKEIPSQIEVERIVTPSESSSENTTSEQNENTIPFYNGSKDSGGFIMENDGFFAQKLSAIEKQLLLKEKYSVLSFGLTANLFNTDDYYSFGCGTETEWHTSKFTAPFYEGINLRAIIAFPSDSFPNSYHTLDGKDTIASPNLLAVSAAAKAGIRIPVSTTIQLFTEILPFIKCNSLVRPGVAASNPCFSAGCRFKTGILIKKFSVSAGVEYDSMWGWCPEFSAAFNIRLSKGEKK